MKNSICRGSFPCILASAVFISGCATVNPFAKSESSEQTATKTAAQSALMAGIDLYNAGDYAGAVKRLDSAGEIWKADKPTQLEALKYMAFSYCVTSHQALCKQQFEKALKLDPAFDLAPGEKGHPLWGPVFDRAKKSK